MSINWRTLQNNECPLCGGSLREADQNELVKCEEFGSTCSFSVYATCLQEMLDEMETEEGYATYGEPDRSW